MSPERKDKETPISDLSGFGAHRVLAPEAGLHVFEPFEGSGNRVTARVRLAVVPLGDVPAAKERRLVDRGLDEAPRPNKVVRRYREEPPLVRDAAGNGAPAVSISCSAASSICCRPASADACLDQSILSSSP